MNYNIYFHFQDREAEVFSECVPVPNKGDEVVFTHEGEQPKTYKVTVARFHYIRGQDGNDGVFAHAHLEEK